MKQKSCGTGLKCQECGYFDRALRVFQAGKDSTGNCTYRDEIVVIDGEFIYDKCPLNVLGHDFYEIVLAILGRRLGFKPETEGHLGQGKADVIWWYAATLNGDELTTLPSVVWEIEREQWSGNQVVKNARKIIEGSRIVPHFFVHVVSKPTYNRLRRCHKNALDELHRRHPKQCYWEIVDFSKADFGEILSGLLSEKRHLNCIPLYAGALSKLFEETLEVAKKIRQRASAWKDLRRSVRQGAEYNLGNFDRIVRRHSNTE